MCLLFSGSSIGQDAGVLYLNQNKLKGSCENKYFTRFEIELDSIYSSMDSTKLFSQLPRIGKINFKNRVDIVTEFVMTKRAGYPQIMFRFKSDYLTFDNLDFGDQFVSFVLDDDPNVPATNGDLEIIRLAKKLLSEEKYWNKEDDRDCTDDLENKSYSIYCAIRIASLQIEEQYNHRNAALQKLRHLIEDQYPSKKWNHRLMDYNNMDEISYTDIINMLNQIEQDFVQEMKTSN